MKITEEAKVLIEQAFEANDCDCLQAFLEESCCGKALSFTLVKMEADDKPISVDGVPVLLEGETLERAEKVTLSAEDGGLIMEDEDAPNCSCCGASED